VPAGLTVHPPFGPFQPPSILPLPPPPTPPTTPTHVPTCSMQVQWQGPQGSSPPRVPAGLTVQQSPLTLPPHPPFTPSPTLPWHTVCPHLQYASAAARSSGLKSPSGACRADSAPPPLFPAHIEPPSFPPHSHPPPIHTHTCPYLQYARPVARSTGLAGFFFCSASTVWRAKPWCRGKASKANPPPVPAGPTVQPLSQSPWLHTPPPHTHIRVLEHTQVVPTCSMQVQWPGLQG
jgi:hypothetical protein